MILLVVALLLPAQETPAQGGQAPQPNQAQQSNQVPQSKGAQTPAPKPYSGPHTLAKTWGDLYPGLRAPSKPVHPTAAGAKLAAANKSAALPAKGVTTAVPNKALTSGAAADRSVSAPNGRPATSGVSAAPSSQMTFFNGANKTTDGRMDVMHFHDGKMAVTMGKDWNCSYANDSQQHRVVIICDGQHARP